MAIGGINGGGGAPRIPAQAVAEAVLPQAMQALAPQDTLGIQSRSQGGGRGFNAGTRLADLKPEQMSSLGGGGSLETIAQSQPNTTVGEIGPLLRNRGALDTIAGLMGQRKDLKVGDFISTDQKGRTRIDPSYKDPKVMDLLKERPDITPSQLTAMRQNMARTLKNPQLGKMAAEKGFNLLKKRSDLKPEDMGKMLDTMRTAVGDKKKQGGGGGQGDDAGAMAALDMFDSASKLMEKRTDIKPERMGQLAQSVGGLSSPKDRNGPQNIAEGFESASKSLEKNALRKPEDMAKLAGTMNDHFRGGDEKSSQSRMNAFKQGAETMGENQSVDHNSYNKMLTQAAQRDPKIKNGEGAQRNKRLGKVMDDVTTGVKQGTVAADDLSSHFRNQDAERARFQVEDPKKKEKKKAGKSEEGDKAKQGEQKPKTGEAEKPAKTEEGAKKDGTQQASEAAKAGDPEGLKTPGGEAAKKEEPPKTLAAAQEEEQSAGTPAKPGEGPAVSTEQVAAAKGPGQAAGTESSGVPKGTTPQSTAASQRGGGEAQVMPTAIQPGPKKA